MTIDPSQAIADLMERSLLAQAAYVAAELRLADHFAGEPVQVDELALAHWLSPAEPASPFARAGDTRNLY